MLNSTLWYSFLLSNREFSVLVEGEMSTPRIMKAGVPQGSGLFPTLFNMYTNDTPQTIGVHLALFADDTCLCDRTQGGLCPKKTSAWALLNGVVVQEQEH
jgi:hypothetical protein